MLRKGKLTGTGKVADLDHKAMAAMMIGDQPIAALDSRRRCRPDAESILTVKALKAPDRTGLKTIDIGDLDVSSGEIVGIAGISGNGQKEFSKCWPGSARAMPAKSWSRARPMRATPRRGARAQCPLHPGGAAAAMPARRR